MCLSLCTTVAHNTALNSSDNLPSYPPDIHRRSPTGGREVILQTMIIPWSLKYWCYRSQRSQATYKTEQHLELLTKLSSPAQSDQVLHLIAMGMQLKIVLPAGVLTVPTVEVTLFFMATLRSRCGHYIFVLWFLLSSFFFFYFLA